MCSCRLWLRYSLVLLALAFCVGAPQLKPPAVPAAEFSSHRETYPSLQHARTKRDLSSTRDEKGTHHPEVMMTITVDGEEYLLSLQLNGDIVTADHTIAYQQDGETMFYKPTKEEMDLCHYSGVVEGKPGSWAAVSTCKGVSGAIFDGQKALAIEPAEDSEISNRHYLYDFDDSKTYYKQHSVDIPEPKQSVYRHKRNVENEQILMPYNSNNSSRYVELLMVVDNGLYKRFGSSIHDVHAHVLKLNNILNSIYNPLNIYTALVGVIVWSERDKISTVDNNNKTDTYGTLTLENFNEYLKTSIRSKIHYDHAQLLSSAKWTTEVGWAYVGTMCKENSTAILTDQHHQTAITAEIMAHEMGHSFGMNHTDPICRCPDGNCIMMNILNYNILHWSPCSIKIAAKANFECLLNKPTKLFSSSTCGNGFVEVGEQCDCGFNRENTPMSVFKACNMCCNDTCQLRNSVECNALKNNATESSPTTSIPKIVENNATESSPTTSIPKIVENNATESSPTTSIPKIVENNATEYLPTTLIPEVVSQ